MTADFDFSSQTSRGPGPADPVSESRAGFFTRIVMGLSGGKVQDIRTANQIVLVFGIAIFAVSLIIFLYGFFGSGTPENLPQKTIDQRQFVPAPGQRP